DIPSGLDPGGVIKTVSAETEIRGIKAVHLEIVAQVDGVPGEQRVAKVTAAFRGRLHLRLSGNVTPAERSWNETLGNNDRRDGGVGNRHGVVTGVGEGPALSINTDRDSRPTVGGQRCAVQFQVREGLLDPR